MAFMKRVFLTYKAMDLAAHASVAKRVDTSLGPWTNTSPGEI